MNQEEHKKVTVSAVKWNALNQIIVQVITFGIGILLMRFLMPSEFGLLGMVTVFSGFVSVLGNFGLGVSLIQKKNIDTLDIDTLFFMNIFLGIILTGILFLSSSLIASFYNDIQLRKIAQFISFTYILNSIAVIPLSILKKELKFKNLFILNMIPVTISGVVAIILAFYNFGVWTLVYRQILSGILTAIIVWFFIKWRPSIRFSFSRLKKHLDFGLPLMGTNVFGYWLRNADNLLIGKYLDSDALGLYSRAYNLMMLPITQISRVISSVMLPSFSIIQDQEERIKQIYMKFVRVIAFITFPLMGILFIIADPLVRVVFGENWLQLIPLLKIFSIVGAIGSINTLNGNIYISQGKTSLMFRLRMVTSIITVVAFYIAVQFGIKEVALAFLITVLLKLVPNIYFMGKLVNIGIKEFFVNLKPYFTISFSLVILGFYIFERIEDISYLGQLGIIFLYYIMGYWILLWLFYRGSIDEIVSVFNNEIFSRKN